MKTAILVTARLKSTRLPLKVLKPIKGRPMLAHMLDRLKLSKCADEIIICTSPVEQDDPLVAAAEEYGVKVFRGDPDDVLLRITEAARQFNVTTVISCTADNPFVDPEYIDKLYDYHCANGHDYSKTDGMPWGTFAYALSVDAMERACEMKKERDTEVWGGYFTDTDEFHWGVMKVDDPSVNWPELRLTVDTPEDFELISRIFDELYEDGQVFTLQQIVKLCRANPELPAINSSVEQKAGIPIQLKSQQDAP